MSQPNTSPATFEIPPQALMATRVLELLKRHPLTQPLRDAGEPILIGSNAQALFARAVPTGADQYELEVRIEQGEWWIQRMPHWAERLAQRLATGLRQQWEQRATAEIS